jgi:hypothetical protein
MSLGWVLLSTINGLAVRMDAPGSITKSGQTWVLLSYSGGKVIEVQAMTGQIYIYILNKKINYNFFAYVQMLATRYCRLSFETNIARITYYKNI